MKCPVCGKELNSQCLGTESFDERYYEYFEATCPNCLTDWEWYDMYEYTESSVPVPIDPNDRPKN